MSKKLGTLVSLALESTHKGTSGFEFENFAQNLSRCQFGDDFFATSPFKDDGIDGFKMRISEDTVISKHGKPEIIYQYGTTENFTDKIRATHNDLTGRGINVRSISYYSPRSISQITRKVHELEDELDIAIKVIDQAQLCNMASNNECPHIFKEFTTTMLGVLESEDDKNITLDYPALYLSAWYRYEDKSEQNKTVINITDNLIIWALRDTDPEKHIFMSEANIYKAIEHEFPTAKASIKSMFNDRLKVLNKRKTESSRQTIQKHNQNYCLPVESRKEFKRKNDESKETLLLAKASLLNRIEDGYSNERKIDIVELVIHTIKHVFTKQGMKLTKNITGEDEDAYEDINLRDAIHCACEDLSALHFKSKEQECASKILRRTFAKPSDVEQEYLRRSSYLYIMHYIMHNNMDIVSYFQEKTKRLTLVVHSDIILLALSEEYLPKEGQHYRNMLNYLISSGATLKMTEEALTEVYMNLRIASYEYRNNIQSYENHFTPDNIKYLPVLMTRAYLYSKTSKLVSSWEAFINNFCSPENLHNNKGKASAKEELRIFLTDKFTLDMLKSSELDDKIDIKLAESLTEILKPYKKKDEIARHVAKVNLYISSMRHENKEISKNPFGYKTYWLTREKRVYNIAEDFFHEHEIGTHLIMRPEFIIQQIMFTPDSDSIAKSYTSTFPTALGMQMSQQLSPATFQELMKKLNKISKLNDSRAKALLNDVIQVAAEKTKLTQDMNFYAHEALPENKVELFNGGLKKMLEDILTTAEERLNERSKTT